MFCLFSERSSPRHWLRKDRASLGGRAVRSDAAAGNSSSCQAARQEEGASSSSTAADEKALSLLSRFQALLKGLKFLLSARKSEVKGQESPTSTEQVEHHRRKQSDGQINFLLLLTRRYHHHRQK